MISTKKTAMIALKSVKMLPAMMLAVERDVAGAGVPSARSREAASTLVSPLGMVASVTGLIVTCSVVGMREVVPTRPGLA